ncbi:alpha/beta fold hydrolase [Deinococcus aestuarii]|uniref:alpha/beta fold hydrolase n=1 Tax=Deinococcus aestuarii TaxID=2774531 RepID=UPI001C0CD938|nr:alpha/beta hydrolase [Deinococcus aestuarii]
MTAIWQGGFVEVNGHRLHVQRTGGPRPPLVLLHGLTSNAASWTRAARVLGERYDVVAYDARGHGQSQRAEGPFELDDRVADLGALLGALGLDTPALIGHSMGAETAAVFTARHPGQVRALILEDPPFVEPRPEPTPQERARREARLASFRERVSALRTAPPEDALRLAREVNPGWRGEDLRAWAASLRDVEEGMFALFSRPPHLEWREEMRAVRCPFLLLTGDAERGGIVTGEQARTILGDNPAGRTVHLPGTGHNLRFDDFGAFIGAVENFLRRHDPAWAATRP